MTESMIGGTIWRAFKMAEWMKSAGKFTIKQCADTLDLPHETARNWCWLAADAGFLEECGRGSGMGRPILYHVPNRR